MFGTIKIYPLIKIISQKQTHLKNYLEERDLSCLELEELECL